MTDTPEDRARKLLSVEIPDGMGEASFGELDEYLFVRIAQAIRQAEDAKVDQIIAFVTAVAQRADGRFSDADSSLEALAAGAGVGALESLVERLPALKSEQGT